MTNLGCINGKVHISAQVDNDPIHITIGLRFPEGCNSVWFTESEANDLTDVINHVIQSGDENLPDDLLQLWENFKSAEKGDCTCG